METIVSDPLADPLVKRLHYQRGCPSSDISRDKERAGLIREQYPFYLAHQMETAGAQTIGKIAAVVPAASVVLVAVMDGSTETMQAAYERVFLASPFNGKKPTPKLMARKEQDFVQYCQESGIEAKTLFCSGGESNEAFPYRDACIATFGDEEVAALSDALSCAVDLLHTMQEQNQLRQLDWQDQCHARISVADTVSLALSNLYFARRGNLILAPQLIAGLSNRELKMLSAMRMRSGAAEVRNSDDAWLPGINLRQRSSSGIPT